VAFDQYRNAERDWLQEALKSPEFKNAPFKVCVIHMPPFGGWHGEEEIATKFVPLLNEAKIDIMMCGHLHKYLNQKPENGVNFPVIVNSNNTVLKAEATSEQLTMKILNEKGEQVDLIQLKK
jgi:predicted phosphohydrolase